MPYEVKLTKTAQKVYDKVPGKLQAGLDRCFIHLEADPKRNPNIKKFKGFPGHYRYQVGGWRILYEVDETQRTVTVYEIWPRGNVYKGH
ncbi:type II toxin-antitoxin system RelE family toxin [Desulfobacca acetoxidans]|uniref:Plasmid stabilization system n=1 Tax=Desulfobacca acetoxidans (strain ATCC 700848 / DSM 11109 / ASRB2) TaxID=880072 RepID=F2NCW0_DESAR|nr:plasmid stabilization system [Desulfobacca acetoxidans DSM 11109]